MLSINRGLLLAAASIAAPLIIFSSNASAAPSQDDVTKAAIELAHQYDSNYAVKNADAMASLYTEDGTLVSPGGTVIKGHAALKKYYEGRFASGAKEHHIKVQSAETQGDGGFSISDFTVEAPKKDGSFHKESGHILAVIAKDASGWRFRAVEPSVAGK